MRGRSDSHSKGFLMTSERLKDWKRYQREVENARYLAAGVVWDRSALLGVKLPMATPIEEAYVAANASRLVRWSDGHVEEIPEGDLLPDHREPPVPALVADTKKPKSRFHMDRSDCFFLGILTGLVADTILVKIFS